MKRLLTSALISAAVLAGGSSAKAQEKSLNLLAWSEYVPQTVIEAFSKETGIRVNYETYASNEELMAKLLAGATAYDVIQPSEYTVEALKKVDALSKLDPAKLTNLANIDPKYLNMAHDPGNVYSVPWMVGTVGIVVDTDTVKTPITGYGDMFVPAHKGRIVVADDAREMLSWVMSFQGKDINDITPEAIEAARPVMAEWMKLIKVYDSDSPKTALINGEVDLGIVWSGEAAILHQEDPKFKFVLPVEGAHMFLDNLAIPAGSKNPDGAHAFINFILRPEISKLISDEFPYTNPNLAARKLLTEEQLANPASYPPGDPKLEIFRDIGMKASEIDQLYTDLKNSQ